MRVANLFCLAAGLFLVAPSPGRPQPQQPPDYRVKTLAEWIEALKDRDQRHRHQQARQALGPTGPYAEAAVPALIDLLHHKESTVRWDAAMTVADHGPAIVPVLLRSLKRPEAPVREGVAEVLGLIRPRAAEAVPALLEAIKDSDTDVRAAAALALGRIGLSPSDTIPALTLALRDKSERVRVAAAAAFVKMGRRSRPAVPALITALKDDNPFVRTDAASTLRAIGPDARAAVPELIEGLKQKNESVQLDMIHALGGIGPEAKAAVPALVEALREKESLVRQWAMDALGKIGPSARAAVPALLEAVKADDLGDFAIRALGKIGPDARAAVPVFMEALARKKDTYERDILATALGGIGPDARVAVPALTAIAQDRSIDSQARQAAARAVMKIDPVLGAKHQIELACLNIRLGKVPDLKLASRPPLTVERKQHIQQLITELATVDHIDFGLSPATLAGPTFAPLPEHQGRVQVLLLTGQPMKTASAFRSLVEIGPEALPFLLEALTDRRPTRLKVRPAQFTSFGSELMGNPLNALERRLLPEEETDRNKEEDEETGPIDYPYTVKVGDVCFVAIGQIVGRPYSALRYIPSGFLAINSPLERKALRERVRAIWSSKDPAQKLFDSLLLDYATEGIPNGELRDGWTEGSDFQVEAALRLLYYFPRETTPLIAARLRSLDVQSAWGSGLVQREVKNRVRAADFLKAVSWSQAPAIEEALADLARRTNDPDIKDVLDRRARKNP
jgi:HEAT repeat protein